MLLIEIYILYLTLIHPSIKDFLVDLLDDYTQGVNYLFIPVISLFCF
jgi:hypothetical protein